MSQEKTLEMNQNDQTMSKEDYQMVELLDGQITAALGGEKAGFVLKNAKILNAFTEEWEDGDVAIEKGTIVGVGSYEGEKEVDCSGKFIVPAFIDGHMHLESSVVTPDQYAQAVVPHGTTAVVADPHEIANVCGKKGIDYILYASRELPMDVFVMIPSCVPATPFDESGYVITHKEMEDYMSSKRVLGLAELMNYPGVFMKDKEVLSKVSKMINRNKIIDGHAPGLTDKELNAYTTARVTSDHECTTDVEAKEKLKRGQWIMVREGTACKNLESLISLFEAPYYSRCLLATDDKHPGDLKSEGHIDFIIKKAISLGADPIKAYKMASFNAAQYFHLSSMGAICPGYQGDLVILNDYKSVDIESVYKKGELVASKGKTVQDARAKRKSKEQKIYDKTVGAVKNTINISDVTANDFTLQKEQEKVIGLVPSEILTTDEGYASEVDTTKDIVKLAVVERHHNTGHIGVSFMKGYGIKEGAIATTIAHDSHNIIVAGVRDEDMACAVLALKEMQGGMVVVKDGEVQASLSLPIAGLMCELPVEECQKQMDLLKETAYKQGVSRDIDPFMTLSFASLPVIPTLRLTTKGVVDVTKFALA